MLNRKEIALFGRMVTPLEHAIAWLEIPCADCANTLEDKVNAAKNSKGVFGKFIHKRI